MNVLVVEDDEEKLVHLTSFLRSSYSDVTFATAKSYQSGLRSALSNEFDLILLDMTMRNYDRGLGEDGGRPHHFAGREILRQMKRHRVGTPAIVVTHFDRFGEDADYMTLQQLKAELVHKFSNYLGTVQYRGNVDEWKPALLDIINSCGLGRKVDR